MLRLQYFQTVFFPTQHGKFGAYILRQFWPDYLSSKQGSMEKPESNLVWKIKPHETNDHPGNKTEAAFPWTVHPCTSIGGRWDGPNRKERRREAVKVNLVTHARQYSTALLPLPPLPSVPFRVLSPHPLALGRQTLREPGGDSHGLSSGPTWGRRRERARDWRLRDTSPPGIGKPIPPPLPSHPPPLTTPLSLVSWNSLVVSSQTESKAPPSPLAFSRWIRCCYR
jgi:hypothetical protein